MDKATWALVLSGLAILVTAIIGILTAIIGVRGNRLQRRVTIIEEDRRSEELEARARADVHARLDPPGIPKYLVLSVTGGTAARDVVVKVEPASILYEGELTDFPSIEPNQDVRVHVAITSDDFPPGVARLVRVSLRWEDDRGPQTKDVNLTV